MPLRIVRCSLQYLRSLFVVFLVAKSVCFGNWAGAYTKFRFRVATCGLIGNVYRTCTASVVVKDDVLSWCRLNTFRSLLAVVVSLQASPLGIGPYPMSIVRWCVSTCIVFASRVFSVSIIWKNVFSDDVLRFLVRQSCPPCHFRVCVWQFRQRLCQICARATILFLIEVRVHHHIVRLRFRSPFPICGVYSKGAAQSDELFGVELFV